ncbi:phage holin family protein [Oscillatoria amoena NRMC-F 0135]|nr:phage holin family protein [Oscillatoria laete-virens]MDL5051052.1 phage holin family protein [Oscillatoria amoena NRMC-F 0135]MDL5054499.1 phage holin family protein [Oscillatoria laete-virens NRMC-F 0139]
MDEGIKHRPVSHLLHRIGSTFLSILGTRLELVQLELEEERRRLVMAILASTVIGVFLMIGVSLLAIYIVVKLYWAFGLIALIPVAIVALIIAALLFQFLLKPLVNFGQTFSESIAQIKRDGQWLSEQFARDKHVYSSPTDKNVGSPDKKEGV